MERIRLHHFIYYVKKKIQKEKSVLLVQCSKISCRPQNRNMEKLLSVLRNEALLANVPFPFALSPNESDACSTGQSK